MPLLKHITLVSSVLSLGYGFWSLWKVMDSKIPIDDGLLGLALCVAGLGLLVFRLALINLNDSVPFILIGLLIAQVILLYIKPEWIPDYGHFIIATFILQIGLASISLLKPNSRRLDYLLRFILVGIIAICIVRPCEPWLFTVLGGLLLVFSLLSIWIIFRPANQ